MIVNADSNRFPHAAETRVSARRAVKHVLATALAPFRPLRRAFRAPEVHLFGYHRVVEDVARESERCMAPLHVSVAAFEAHLDHLVARYEVLSLEDAVAALAGRRPVPRDVAVLTFDDGYRDILEVAAPILARRGLPATMFVSTEVLDRERPLSHDRLFGLVKRVAAAGTRILGIPVPDEQIWPLARADYALEHGDPIAAADAILQAFRVDEVRRICDLLAARVGEPDVAPTLDWEGARALTKHGFTLGAHTVSHAHLPLESDRALERELRVPRERFAEKLGLTPTALAYPAGRYDARVVAAARQAGYTIAVTTEDRANRAGADPLLLGRKCLSDEHGVGVFGRRSPALVAAHLDGLFTTLGLTKPAPGDFRLEAPCL